MTKNLQIKDICFYCCEEFMITQDEWRNSELRQSSCEFCKKSTFVASIWVHKNQIKEESEGAMMIHELLMESFTNTCKLIKKSEITRLQFKLCKNHINIIIDYLNSIKIDNWYDQENPKEKLKEENEQK